MAQYKRRMGNGDYEEILLNDTWVGFKGTEGKDTAGREWSMLSNKDIQWESPRRIWNNLKCDLIMST